MKINTQNKIKALDNKELDLTIGQAIANILLASETGGKMKLFILAQKFFQDKFVDIDKADLDLVKNSIENSKGIYTALVTGQLLVMLDEIKEESKK